MDNDTISRQAAIKFLKAKLAEIFFKETAEKNIEKWINELPPVQSEQKTGRWIEQIDTQNDVYYMCSNCKEAFTLIEGTPTDNLYNYCPNCGSYNGGKENG